MGGSTLPLAPDAFSGRKLGKYEVLCRLSTGGMAEIFLASQRGLAGFRKLVVLKQILPDIAGEEEFVQMFLDEARVTAAFNHPHIAQVFDLDVADGELFLAMEFVPGATLVEVAKSCRAVNEPIPMGFSLEAVRDTALALHYAHTFTDPLGRPASVIHRDVAEKNIMVTYEGVTKLLDFGIAKNLARKSRTQVGMVKGTSGYMSPEQILGEPLDARSDLFSLGVVLHECLTGLRLFHAKTPEAGASAVLQGQVPPPSRANKAIPPELDAIVLKALGRKREDRYSTTLEFARALERAVGPLIWHPEQSGELISRLFSERREQNRQLLVAGRALSGESTGQINVAAILAPPAQLAEEPVTDGDLPQITAAPLSPARSPAPSPAGLPVKTPAPPPPPAQEPLQTKPPTPPRGSPSRRGMTSGGSTAAPPEPSSIRRPVFEPIPQKRLSTTTSSDLPVPPPPPQETSSRALPGDVPVPPPPPAWTDENSTRAAPLEEPSADGADGDDESQPAVRTTLERLPPPSRPPRMDLHTMGTIPHLDGHGFVAKPDEEAPQEESRPAVRTSSPRNRPTLSSERLPSISGNPNARPARRRTPTTPPPEEEELQEEEGLQEEEDSQIDLQTNPIRVAVPEEPREDTNETVLPDEEDPLTILTAPTLTIPSKRRSGGLLVVLAVAMLLLGLLGAAVALGLDGGRFSGLLGLNTPPPSTDLSRLEPLKQPAKRAQPASPAPAQAPASKPGTAAVASTGPTPSGGTAPAPSPAPPAPAAMAAPTPPLATTAPDPIATPPAVTGSAPTDKPQAVAPSEPEEEPSAPEKKPHSPTKRTRRDSKTSAGGEGEDGSSDDEPASAPAGAGALTLVTNPYAKVYLGRRYLGDTPLFKISLPSGKHSLKLVSADGRNLHVPVEIKPGETTALKLALDQLDPG
ncbi:MAG: protein kinase domain-containing protein [Hyalangium sp.]|uniref:protein kinase domain-containing protein n=1 Tax=Hyalangium sp. TaxID=2028555 RepID=UPI003899A453